MTQESLAEAKVSARQKCVYEGPKQKNNSKSTTCDFLLTVNGKRVVASRICEIMRNSEKIQTYSSSRSFKLSTLVPIESAYATSY